jgi:hypothetical protein
MMGLKQEYAQQRSIPSGEGRVASEGMYDRLRAIKADARKEAILKSVIEMGQVRCVEGSLRVSPLVDTCEIRLRGPSALDYSVRFAEARFIELVDQSRVPVSSDELVRMLLCLICHHPEQYAWVTRESPSRRDEDGVDSRNRFPPEARA